MSIFGQILQVAIVAPLTVLRLRGRALALLFVYLLLAAGVLGVAAWQIMAHKDDALHLITAYLFPDEWRFAAEKLVEHFLSTQVRAVLLNATVAGALFGVTALLFRVKEALSIAVERQLKLSDKPQKPFPVWFQGWEELVLFLAFIGAQVVVFWIGYPPDARRRQIATVLSYAVLFASYALNFISPILQRHGLRYGTIAKTLLKNPIAMFGFGAMFGLPPILITKLAAAHPNWALRPTLALLLAVNVACIAWAAVAGTWIGARLLPSALAAPRTSGPARLLGWAALLALLAVDAWGVSVVTLSLHHKSQILKCRYKIVPDTLHIDLPKLSQLSFSQVTVTLRADVEIENPTEFNVEVEQNRLEVRNAGVRVAETSISPVAVPAGGRVTTHLVVPVVVRPETVRLGRSLLDSSQWELTLFLQVSPRLELPVHILRPGGG